MDINKNQQVNTFLKGMNTDISDSLIDTSQYRYAENLQLTTNTEHNTGELRLVEGNKELYNFGEDNKIIYVNSTRDYVVVICANSGESWSIYVNDNKGVGEWTCIFGPCTDLLWDSLDDVAISGVLRYESNNNIKLYLTDNTRRHVIIPIQIDRSHWQETPSTSIVSLTGYQDVFLNAPVATIFNNSGHLKPAKVQYIYRLYKLGGAATTLSPAGNVLPLYKSSSEGYSDKEVTNKAVTITIQLGDIEGLNRIQVFRITYQYNGQLPTVHRIEDKAIDPSIDSIQIQDYGDNREQLGVDELLSLTQMQIKPKIIESKGDTLFAANIKYVQDDVDGAFSNYDTRSFSSGNYWKLNTPVEEGGELVTERPIQFSWDTRPFSVTGGCVIDLSDQAELCHRAFNDNPNNTYDKTQWYTYDKDLNRTTYQIGGKGSNIDWRFETETVTISNSGRQSENVRNFYRSGETYRFGAVLYNNKGQAGSVKWIADIQIPPRKPEDYIITGEGVCQITVHKPIFIIKNFPEGCKAIQIVQCPRKTDDRRTITQGIVGFPMRMRNEYDNADTNYICPSGLMTLQRIYADNRGLVQSGNPGNVGDNGVLNRTADSATNVLQFASPEYSYQADDIKNILNTYSNQIQLQHVAAFDIYSDQTLNVLQDYFVYPKTQDTSNSTYGIGFGYKNINYNNSGWYLKVDESVSGYGPYWDFVGGSPAASYHYLNSANRNFLENKLIKKLFKSTNIDDSNWKYGYIAFNHIIPKTVNYHSSLSITYPSIRSLSYPQVPAWNKFAEEQTIRFNDDVTAIGSDSYINWTYPLCMDFPTGSDSKMAECLKDTGQADNDEGRAGFLYPIGTGGKCILIKLNSNVTFPGQSFEGGLLYRTVMANGYMAPISVANIVKQCTPYGGYNKESIYNSIYCGHGDIVTKENYDINVGSDINNPNPYELEVTGGDSYICYFKYNAAHLWYDPIYIAATKQATVYEVPIETDIDLDADNGTKYSSDTNLGYYIQDEVASLPSITGGYSQDKPAYQYNTAYNQYPNVITYSSIEQTDISNYDWDVRVHNSDLKTNGESIDSWLTFKALNYLDVDSRHGEITELKLFKDMLIFWQDDAVGVLSSNERTMLNDASGNQIILGNGGILQRSDYISTTYGMKKDQFASTQSNTTLYWWDGNNKEIVAYSDRNGTYRESSGVYPLGSIKSVRNYLNERQETERPFLFYDIKNKEVVCSVVKSLENPPAGESLVYSEQIEAFSSIYKFAPLYGTELADQILTTNDTTIYKQNVTKGGVSTLFGNEMLPKLQYVVNSQNMFPKVFDIQTFGGRFYGGDNITALQFDYKTPLKQHSSCTGSSVTNREYDFRLDIPRNNNDVYGGRMRGKTMECELTSTSNSTDFSLQYIVTKYRMSWS